MSAILPDRQEVETAKEMPRSGTSRWRLQAGHDAEVMSGLLVEEMAGSGEEQEQEERVEVGLCRDGTLGTDWANVMQNITQRAT